MYEYICVLWNTAKVWKCEKCFEPVSIFHKLKIQWTFKIWPATNPLQRALKRNRVSQAKKIFRKDLRVWWFLIWHILDKILAKQGFKDIIQISQFVELAFILRKTCVKFFSHAYTLRHISETGRPKSKRKIYLLSGFILK